MFPTINMGIHMKNWKDVFEEHKSNWCIDHTRVAIQLPIETDNPHYLHLNQHHNGFINNEDYDANDYNEMILEHPRPSNSTADKRQANQSAKKSNPLTASSIVRR